ncbi:hypothetical protein N7481_004747 [Penicillium waksmanii]|uniref:uncharacterized protein n=1 Tax=Penicillium waksmanii TaxID=69791 RepID=UPI0025492B6D|nr:uncharacterized protein N7481_004747 [Penicillium waksmanii]KAJ5989537.1 hypothetical protein N7481_004747 [Penicillium waksmanii]
MPVWHVEDVIEDDDPTCPLPHTALMFKGGYKASEWGHYFTIFELRALVEFLLIHSLDENTKSFPGHRTHPSSTRIINGTQSRANLSGVLRWRMFEPAIHTADEL